MGDGELPRYPLSRRARVLVVVAAVIAAGAYRRLHYGIWPGARHPSALYCCGRNYNADHPAVAHSYRVHAGQPRNLHVDDTPTCTVKVYLQTGAHRYRSYHLDGSAG